MKVETSNGTLALNKSRNIEVKRKKNREKENKQKHIKKIKLFKPVRDGVCVFVITNGRVVAEEASLRHLVRTGPW